MTGTELHPSIDVLPAGESLFVHPDRAHQIRAQQEVDDEPGAVLRLDGVLTEPRDELLCARDRLVAGVQRPHDLHQFHHPDG